MITVTNGCVHIAGRLSDNVSQADLTTAFIQAKEPHRSYVRLDLRQVDGASSSGVLALCRAFDAVDFNVLLCQCPMHFVEHMNINQDLLRKNVWVESFEAPYF